MKLKIRVRSSLLIGGYSNITPFVDKTTARLIDGAPIIPASTIKGAIRVEFERLFAPECSQEDDPGTCAACSIFGKRGDYSGLLVFSDGVLGDEHSLIFSEVNGDHRPSGVGYIERPGVAINRKSRTSEDKKLFTYEATDLFDPAEGLEFVAHLEVSPELEHDPRLWKMLQASVNSVFAIGGSKSRGMGFCTFELISDDPSPALDEVKPRLTGPVINLQLLLVGRHLTIGANKPYQHLLETRDYITGCAVRGALAKAMVRRASLDPQSDAPPAGSSTIPGKLMSFFVSSDLIFDDCLPSQGFVAARLVPASARTCKIHPGFKGDS
ncbi:MAG: RAMP superfamily CRISPR-associated protein, partial [Syntrophobacteraceae bacterium]